MSPAKTKRQQTKSPQKTKSKSIFSRIRNFIIYSTIMMILGGSAEKYHEQILDFLRLGAKPAIERIVDYTQDTFRDITGKKTETITKSSPTENVDLGIPASTNQFIKHQYYMLGYNSQTKQANWVSYTLTKPMLINKKVNREDNFRPDPMVKNGSAELSDYRRSGYDRGHLCPAADMAFNAKAMSETFYLSNISPQVPAFNRGIWKMLEEKVRDWSIKNGKVYVVTGPVFYSGKKNKFIGKNKVEVPNAFYKVLLVYSPGKSKAIGFLIPNQDTKKRLIYFSMPVDNIERITNINFFGFLPEDIEEEVESTCNYYQWG